MVGTYFLELHNLNQKLKTFRHLRLLIKNVLFHVLREFGRIGKKTKVKKQDWGHPFLTPI